MTVRHIKAKLSPAPGAYSEEMATEGEKAEAAKQAEGCGILILGFIAFFPLLFGVFWLESILLRSSLVNPNSAKTLAAYVEVLAFAIAAVLSCLLVLRLRNSARDEHLRKTVSARLLKAHESATENADDEATVLTFACERIYCEQEANSEALRELLRKADMALDRAQIFFRERAFTPFWDSVENAVESLRNFDRRVDYISQSAKEYYGNLAGQEHTFPTFPLDSRDIPVPDVALKRLSEIIAIAQRDFQFAHIFEQRRTTSAIVTGFRNTQEAISCLRVDLMESLANLQRSLETGLEGISSDIQNGLQDLAAGHEQSAADLRNTLDSQAKADAATRSKHQKFVEGALDNIQNRRKPRISETKEPFRRS